MQRRIRGMKKNNQSGFTLIELLIVIVILGILAAIVVFAVSAFNKEGQQAACQTDFKSVEVADEAFHAKTGGYATTQGDLVPDYIKQWPQTKPDGVTPLDKPAYTISLGATGPMVVEAGATTPPQPDVSGCPTNS